jgi:hypothetical protein
LENAQAALHTQEEAETYLKNLLKVGKNLNVENFNVTTLISDSREDSTMDTHGLPWTLVIELSMQRSDQDAPLSKEADRTATGVLNQDYTTPGSRRAFIDRPTDD